MKIKKRTQVLCYVSAFLISIFPGLKNSISCAAVNNSPSDLTELSLEELMNIEITSVSKKAEKLSRAPAAIYVITSEDIKRSGATSLPEVLRMVPGVEVARINSNTWAISVRGFNGRFANKLLVLIDGRSVYTPTFSGVFWDEQDIPLEDIERIEVIRGPGGTLWGANAVNGVINIITKKAKDTQGVLLNTAYGNVEKPLVEARVGSKIGENFYYRIYGKYFKRDNFEDVNGNDAGDEWEVNRTGFRADYLTEKNTFTLEGEVYKGETGENMKIPPYLLPEEDKFTAGNVLARFTHKFSEKSDFSLQFYYDHVERNQEAEMPTIESILQGGNPQKETFKIRLDTYDFDFQHRFYLGKRNEIVWGAGFRLIEDNYQNTKFLQLIPDSRSLHLYSGFVQDEIYIVPEKFSLILGSKFEHNDYTGFEYQPNIRLLYFPSQNHTFWAAVSRAVRTPSRYERDVKATIQSGKTTTVTLPVLGPYPVPVLNQIKGNTDLDSEKLLAFEAGYRGKLNHKTLLDIALFYNKYTDLYTYEFSGNDTISYPAVPGVSIPINILQHENKMDGYSYGGEVSLHLYLKDWWNVKLNYSYLKIVLSRESGSRDKVSELRNEGSSPHHQAMLWSSWNLPHNLYLDAIFYYVDKLPYISELAKIDPQYQSLPRVKDYFSLNLNLTWKCSKNVEFSLVGQNLLDNKHLEYVSVIQQTVPTEIPRTIYGKLEIKF